MAYDKYKSASAVDTSSSDVISTEHDALWIGSNAGGTGGSNGDLKVKMVKDSGYVTFKGVPSGTLMPIEVAEIVDADTKVSEIVSLESGKRWST